MHFRFRALAFIIAVSCTVAVRGQDVYEIGKEGDAPEPPSVKQLTEREICGDWKAEKVGNNQSPVDDLYIYYGEKGFAFEGKYKDWQGQAMAGMESKVTVWRKPKAEEMSDKAPQWAREKVAAEGKLEWKLELKAESRKGEWVLEGKWYPGRFKWTEDPWSETGESNDASRQASYVDEGTPVDVKFTKVPSVVGEAIVLARQNGFYKGFPWHAYPFLFRPKAGFTAPPTSSLLPAPGSQSAGESTTRTLFVYGINLPTDWSKQMDIPKADNTVTYQVLALPTDNNLNSDRKRLLKAGWDAALRGLDSDMEKTVRKCSAMLVRANLQPGVKPGVKKFSINKMPVSWRLRFGDDGGRITFARDLRSNENQDIDCAVVPEKVYIEVRTDTAFPIDEIPLRVCRNDKDHEVRWNNSPVIVAKHVKDVPSGMAYEVPRAAEAAEVVPKVIRIYRTPPIQLSFESSSPGAGYQVQVKTGDILMAKPEDPYLLTLLPWKGALASVKVWSTPNRDSAGKAILTWEEALQKAADLDGYGAKVKAGTNVSGSEAGAVTNVVLTDIAIGKLRPARDAWTEATSHWTSIFWPALGWRFFFGNRGVFTERVSITVADHAALLIFKEAFIRQTSDALTSLEKKLNSQGGEDAQKAMLRGLRESLKYTAAKDSSPWESIRVPGPNGGDVKMSWAIDDGLRKTACKDCTDARADDWSLEAVASGMEQYKAAVKHALQKAKDTPDNDVKKLVELIGYGYENLAPEVMQHLVWHPPNSTNPNWEPNLNAQDRLWNLHTAADAVRAQEDLSKIDSQMALLAASAFAAPFMLSTNAVVMYTCYAFDLATFGGQLVTETLPEALEEIQRNELKFAIGASLVLGTDRLNEAELKRTEWFQTVLNVLPGALGVVLGGEALHSMTRANAQAKSTLVMEVIETHGLEGAKRLTSSEKTAVLVAASEAEMLKEIGETKVLQASHERAAAVGEKLAGEAGASRAARAEADTHVVATGTGTEPAKEVTQEVKYTPELEKEVKTVIPDKAAVVGAETTEPVALPEGGATSVKKGTGTVTGADAHAPTRSNPDGATNLDELERANELRVQKGVNPNDEPLKLQVIMPDNTEEVFELGTKRGKGSVALVYDVVRGKFKDAVAKFFYKGDGFRTPGRIATDQVGISKKLTDAKIPHLKVREVPGCAGADPPFVIQERLPEGAKVFGEGTDPNVVAAFCQREGPGGDLDGPGEAYAKLRRQLADARGGGLDAEDLGWRNVYWLGSKEEGWTCGILDIDHIVPHNQRNTAMGARIDWIESEVTRKTVRSLFAARRTPVRTSKLPGFTDLDFTIQANGNEFIKRTANGKVGPYLPSSEFFAEKMFEHKGWLGCDWLDEFGSVTNSADKAVNGRLKDGVLKLKHVEKYFPNINDPARFKPLDLTEPFGTPGKTPRSSMLQIPSWIRRISESIPPIRDWNATLSGDLLPLAA